MKLYISVDYYRHQYQSACREISCSLNLKAMYMFFDVLVNHCLEINKKTLFNDAKNTLFFKSPAANPRVKQILFISHVRHNKCFYTIHTEILKLVSVFHAGQYTEFKTKQIIISHLN